MTQRVNEQIGALPAIKAEAHFVKVGLQVLGADLVPCPCNASLKQREGRFGGGGVNVGSEADVLLRRVVHSLVPNVAHSVFVGREIIGYAIDNCFSKSFRSPHTLGAVREHTATRSS